MMRPKIDVVLPRCRCGNLCAYYGQIGGYSKRCEDCNAKAAAAQREARRRRKMAAAPW